MYSLICSMMFLAMKWMLSNVLHDVSGLCIGNNLNNVSSTILNNYLKRQQKRIKNDFTFVEKHVITIQQICRNFQFGSWCFYRCNSKPDRLKSDEDRSDALTPGTSSAGLHGPIHSLPGTNDAWGTIRYTHCLVPTVPGHVQIHSLPGTNSAGGTFRYTHCLVPTVPGARSDTLIAWYQRWRGHD